MGEWFGASWSTIGWVSASTAAIYLSALLAVRLAGRRTLAQMSAFDVVVTIALGTLVSSTALSNTPSYLQGMAALVTLLVLQVLLATIRQRVPQLRRYLDFSPETVVRKGAPELSASPFSAQMTEGELLSKLRQHGVFELESARLVILEPTGQLTVVGRDADLAGDALANLDLGR
ncbi:MAG: DUF421 domain-containing protein [Actinomycetota bacterium]|nr:DUF421 domain-containing protein [Actinomycetota bacterium]